MSKQIEVIAIGNELLAGKTVNSNAAYISERLSSIGLNVCRQTVIGDDPKTIQKTLDKALKHNNLVITTGGLGPTVDDITRCAVADLLGAPLTLNEEVLAHLQKRYGDTLPGLEEQATIPKGATPILNHVGTAPGLILGHLIMLPGVPPEMEAMMEDVLRHFQGQKPPKTRELYLHSIREIDVDPEIRKLQKEGLTFGIYPHLGLITVRVTGREADKAINALKNRFEGHLMDAPTIQESIHKRMIEKEATLSCAESCTGGAIAASLTAIPDASKYFLGSIVSYSNDVKNSLLLVPEKTLAKQGSVSEETVQAMLEGLFKQIPSDYGLAVTGIAGPSGGTAEKPVGTLWCAVGKRGEKPEIWKAQLKGNRKSNIIRATHIILGRLLSIL